MSLTPPETVVDLLASECVRALSFALAASDEKDEKRRQSQRGQAFDILTRALAKLREKQPTVWIDSAYVRLAELETAYKQPPPTGPIHLKTPDGRYMAWTASIGGIVRLFTQTPYSNPSREGSIFGNEDNPVAWVNANEAARREFERYERAAASERIREANAPKALTPEEVEELKEIERAVNEGPTEPDEHDMRTAAEEQHEGF